MGIGGAVLAAQLLRRGAARGGGLRSSARSAYSSAAPGDGAASPSAFDAARAAHELDLAKLSLAEKAAAAEAEDRAAARAMTRELELLRLQQGRGAWEALFGLKRETAQLLNLGGGGALFLASAVYLTSGMLHDARATLQVAAEKADDAKNDVRALMSNAQRAPSAPPAAPAAWRGRSFLSPPRRSASNAAFSAPPSPVIGPQPPPHLPQPQRRT